MYPELDHVRDVLATGRRFGPNRNAPSLARRFTRNYLADVGASARCQHVAELLVSELVTNALVHARSNARLWITVADGLARVEVTDDGPGEPVMKEPGPDGGYGLWLTDSLARSWGVIRGGLGTEKTVWFAVPLDGPPA